MTKYEELLFLKSGYCIGDKGKDKAYVADIDIANKKLNLRQSEDITITKYQFTVVADSNEGAIDRVLFFKKGKWESAKNITQRNKTVLIGESRYEKALESKNQIFLIVLDFEDRTEKIKIEYKNNIIEPIELTINYIESNKEAYYKKVAEAQRKELIEKMNITYRTGDSLINVYWKNANESVKQTIFELFLDQDRLIMRDTASADTTFKCATNLGYGSYYFKLTQLDGSGKIIVFTDFMPFSLQRQPIKETVVI